MKRMEISFKDLKRLYSKLTIGELAFHKAALYFAQKKFNENDFAMETKLLMQEINGNNNEPG